MHFTWTHLISFINPEFSHIIYGLLFCGFLVVIGIFARNALKRDPHPAPSGRFGIKGFFEVFVEQIQALSDSVVGPEGREAVPFFCFIFLFIWGQNLLGLFPGFFPATENVNTTFALGVFSFLAYNYWGLRKQGFSYLKQFLGHVMFMAPLFIFIELLSHIFRPLSLGLRLFGNMKGDHVVIGIFLDLVPVFVPIIFYFLGLFVCTLQAFVFTILSMVYVSLAISDHH
ncbi:MAG: F0F1 ATP synthase subunit A [Bdellovibrionales bacterium]|nr:F0F1 ATP synthase subunit A [Bdellovibrionales bacterium]